MLMLQLRARFDKLIQSLRRRSPIAVIGVSSIAIALLLVAGAAVSVVSAWRGLPAVDAIQHIGEMDQATTVYDHYDRFAFSIARERRLNVPLDSISPAMIQAILSIEDRRFYSHPG